MSISVRRLTRDASLTLFVVESKKLLASAWSGEYNAGVSSGRFIRDALVSCDAAYSTLHFRSAKIQIEIPNRRFETESSGSRIKESVFFELLEENRPHLMVKGRKDF